MYYEKKYVLLFGICLLSFIFICLQFPQGYAIQRKHVLQDETLLIIERRETENALQVVGQTQGVLPQRYRLIFSKTMPVISLGAYVQVRGIAEPIESTQNKYLFYYEQYAKTVREFHQVFNPQIKMVQKLSYRQRVYSFKGKLQAYIERTYSGQAQGLLKALILSESTDIKEAYQFLVESGIAQFFVLSASYIKRFKRWLLCVGSYLKIPEWGIKGLLFLFSYTSSLFLWRNIVLKYVVFVLAIEYVCDLLPTEKRLLAFERTAAAGILLLIGNPYVIFNRGFMYLFIFRFGLFFVQAFSVHLKGIKKVLFFFVYRFIIMLPLTLYDEQSIALLQSISYLFFVPLGMAFFLLSLLLLLVPQLEAFFNGSQVLLMWANEHVHGLYQRLTVPISWLFGFQSYLLYFLYFQLSKRKHKAKRLRSIVCLLLFVICMHALNVTINSIHFLSLPYGEITLIKENNVVYLIDVGGNYKERDNQYQTEAIIIPFLEKHHIKHIDHVILTHDDLDHVGDFAFLVEHVSIAHVYYNRSTLAFAQFKSKNPAIMYHQVREPLRIANVQVFSVYAEDEVVSSNNTSLLTYGVFGGKRWLFMGDLEQDGERKLVQMYPDLTVDVLKVGHHGSKTSTSALFLQYVQPQVAIITVQKRNRHQHPHAEVMARLHAQNMTIYSTNVVGSIHFFFVKNQGFFVIE